jgi:hypothetical protein
LRRGELQREGEGILRRREEGGVEVIGMVIMRRVEGER